MAARTRPYRRSARATRNRTSSANSARLQNNVRNLPAELRHMVGQAYIRGLRRRMPFHPGRARNFY